MLEVRWEPILSAYSISGEGVSVCVSVWKMTLKILISSKHLDSSFLTMRKKRTSPAAIEYILTILLLPSCLAREMQWPVRFGWWADNIKYTCQFQIPDNVTPFLWPFLLTAPYSKALLRISTFLRSSFPSGILNPTQWLFPFFLTSVHSCLNL